MQRISLLVLGTCVCLVALLTQREQPSGPRAHAAPRELSRRQPRSRRVGVRHRYVVAAIGDSITDAHVGGGKYLKDLEAHCPKSRFDNYGIGGQFVRNMLDRFDADVFGEKRGAKARPGDRRKPDYTHVIVFGGVNDLISHPNDAMLASAEQDLATMYAKARARGVRIVAMTIPMWAPHNAHDVRMDEAFNRWILEQASGGDVKVVDIRGPLVCEEQGTLCREYRRYPVDTVHWGARGHEVVADALWKSAFADCE